MGDMGDTFRVMREHAKEKRAKNTKDSTEILLEKGVSFTRNNGGAHLIIFESDHEKYYAAFDFWPSTGIFINRKTKKRGRGVKTLLKRLKHRGE